ncbi:putative colanic acid biosynthesis acetyltransferase WcaF [Algoriphagus iocasae]|uniref:Putative colanic acid biosynthesis acetyltransferase WcaF n=1 Tax=Algoriphagus iocasae TaxID=1836499 RepID=A0A841MM34_9BACT|nr:WcaF family extracellular polysaccharide biosynthesis acetyltransferase [Algoriphagus iocasae]MBB6327953.1 putative colanic acid biosynthesis acetyltransferase WcaF [Algoriphagus iocasae]
MLEENRVNFSAYKNNEYYPGPKVKILIWTFINAFFFNNSFAVFNSLKLFILKIFGAKIGANVLIKQSVNIKYPWFLKIGNNVWIGEGVWIDNLTQVSIGNNVCISQGAMLLCGNHDYKKKSFDLILGEIQLDEGVWIGAKAIVCPGVKCHTHSILTVGSIASQNLDGFTIYHGNPAKPVRKRVIQE